MYHFGETHLKLFRLKISYYKLFPQQLATNDSIHLKNNKVMALFGCLFWLNNILTLMKLSKKGLAYSSASADYETNITVIRCWFKIFEADEYNNLAARMELVLPVSISTVKCPPGIQKDITQLKHAITGSQERSLKSLNWVDQNTLHNYCNVRNN